MPVPPQAPPGPPPKPKPVTLSIEDAFSNLVVDEPRAPPPGQAPFVTGEEVLYTDSQGKTTLATVAKVCTCPLCGY